MKVIHNSNETHCTFIQQNFPAISFCPGFKRDRVIELVWPYKWLNRHYNTTGNFSDTFPTTRKVYMAEDYLAQKMKVNHKNIFREEMKKVWKYLTYTPEEVFFTFMATFQPGNSRNSKN